MNFKFYERLLDNRNYESFLPCNLPINLIFFLLYEEEYTDLSYNLLCHSVCVLCSERFSLKYNSCLSLFDTSFFVSNREKYVLSLLKEVEYRTFIETEKPKNGNLDDIFFSPLESI
jgi:hypothetical protein